MRYTKVIPVGLLAAVAAQGLLIPSCFAETSEHTGSVRTVQNIRAIIAADRQLCTAGRLREWSSSDTTYSNASGPLLPVMLTKLRHVVSKQIADPVKQADALAVLDQADLLLRDQLAPAYSKAMKSRRPEDAKALVPILDELNRRMDELLRVLT